MPGFSPEGSRSFWQVGCQRSSAPGKRAGNLKMHITSCLNPGPTISKRIEFNICCKLKSCYEMTLCSVVDGNTDKNFFPIGI